MPTTEQQARLAGIDNTMTEKELNEFTNEVVNASSVEQLEDALGTVDGVSGSHTFYSSDELVQRLYMVFEGYPLNIMTRSHGIRGKVAEFLYLGTRPQN